MCDCVSYPYTSSCSKPKLSALCGISTNGTDILKTLTRYKAISTLTGPNNLEIFTGTTYKIVGDTVHLILDYQFSYVDNGGDNVSIELTGLPVAAVTDGRWASGATLETDVPVYILGSIEVNGTTVLLKTQFAMTVGTNYRIVGEVFYKRSDVQDCIPCECFIKRKKFYTTGLIFNGPVVFSQYKPWTELTLTTPTTNVQIDSQTTYYSQLDDQILVNLNLRVEYTGAQASNEIVLEELPVIANSGTDVYGTLTAYDTTYPDNAIYIQIRTTSGGANNQITIIVNGGPFILGDRVVIQGQIVYQGVV